MHVVVKLGGSVRDVKGQEEYILIIGLIKENTEIRLAREMGFKTIVMNTKLSLEQVLDSDVPIEICLNCESSVLEKTQCLKQKYNIRAVYTLNEYRVPLAAKVRESLGLVYGISYDAANRCRNKKLVRKALESMGKAAVNYHIIQSVNDMEKISDIPLPVVIKPVNDAGSNMVFCCTNSAEVKNAIEKINNMTENSIGQELDKDILVEEFLDGPEYSIEAYTKNKNTTIVAITQKKIYSPFHPIEVGHMVPAPLQSGIKEEIENLVRKSVELLDIDDAVTHSEVKLTLKGARIVEINARPGGDKIPHLVKATTGYDLHRISLLLSLGKPIDNSGECSCRPKKAFVHFFVAENEGIVTLKNMCAIYGNKNIHKFELQVEEGQYVTKTTSNYDRLGYFIAFDEEMETLEKLTKNVLIEKKNVAINNKVSGGNMLRNCENIQKKFKDLCSEIELNKVINEREYSIVIITQAILSKEEHRISKAIIQAKEKGLTGEEISYITALLMMVECDGITQSFKKEEKTQKICCS